MDQLTLALMRNFGETLGLDEAVTQMFGGPLYLTFVCGYLHYKIEQTDCGFEL
jgi:hypothetical protein